MNLIYVAIGGALGSVARYLMQSLVGHYAGSNFPYGTMIVNITGSLIMGVLAGWLGRTMPDHAQNIRLFFAVGVLGGYTTFSSFSLEAITLMEEGRWAAMTAYVGCSVVLSLGGLLVGLRLVRALT